MRFAVVAKVLLPILLLATGVAGFAYLSATRPDQPRPQPRERVWQVDTLVADPGERAPLITLYGSVEAPSLLQAAAPGSAVVAEVAVREGERVDRGQLLVQLDGRDFLPQLTQARADLAEVEAQIAQLELQHDSDREALAEERRLLQLAEAAVARAERLQRQQLGAESALDEARQALVRQQLALASRRLAVDSYAASLAQLRARRERHGAALAQAERDLARSRIAAPFDGIVAAVRVSSGDRVAGGSVLVTLYPLDGLEIRARIPIAYQGEIQAALGRGERLAASARLADRPLRLVLDRVAGSADPSGIDGLFRVAEGAADLRPGNLLELALQRPSLSEVVAVPLQAVYGNSRLYLLREGRMRGIDVETLGQTRDADGRVRLLVRSPAIEAGATIVVTRLPNAVDGLKVEPAQP